MSYKKYAKLQKYVNGSPTSEYKKGRLIASGLTDCEGTDIQTFKRWVEVTGEYLCQGYDKYGKWKEQQSSDNINWTDTGNTKAAGLIEANSTDCGYTPPTPPTPTPTISDCLFTITGVDYTTNSSGQNPFPICVVQEDILTVLKNNGFMLRSWSNYKLPEYDNFSTSSDMATGHQYYYVKWVPEANVMSLAYFVRNTKPCENSFCKSNIEWDGRTYQQVPYGKLLDSDHSHYERLSKVTCS